MRLSAEMFSRVVTGLKSDAGQSEHRTCPRVGIRATADAVTVAGERPGIQFTANVRDISAGGICIITDRKFRSKEMFALILTREDAAPLTLIYVVRHATPAGDRSFKIGAQLVEQGKRAAADLLRAVAPPPRVPPSLAASIETQARIQKAILD